MGAGRRLFRRALRERLDGWGVARRARLHHQAAEWFSKAGRLTEAADHALETGDQDVAAEAINRGARAFVANGQISDAASWLGQFNIEQLDRHPLIRLYFVTALTLAGRFDEAEAENERVAAASGEDAPLSADEVEQIGDQTLFHRELIGTWRRNASEATTERFIGQMAGKRTWLFGESVWLHGLQLLQQGDLAEARRKLIQSEEPLARTGSSYALAVGQTALARLDFLAGEPTRAESRCRTLIDEITCGAGLDVPASVMPRLMLARLAYERNALGEAADLLLLARERAPELSSPEWNTRALLLESALAVARGHHVPVLAARARAAAAACLVRAGRLADALRLVEEHALLPQTADVRPSEGVQARWIRMAAGVRVHVLAGRAERVAGTIAPLVATADRLGHVPMAVEGRITAALALLALGERARAVRTLREDLLAAQAAGLPRLVIDLLDPSLAALVGEFEQLEQIGGDDRSILSRDFLRSVAGGDASRWRRPTGGSQQHRDLFRQRSLTDKEIEVLDLVEAGLSNQQIGDELFISVGTVKWHVRNILNKLGARNRTAAIRLARSIVPTDA